MHYYIPLTDTKENSSKIQNYRIKVLSFYSKIKISLSRFSLRFSNIPLYYFPT